MLYEIWEKKQFHLGYIQLAECLETKSMINVSAYLLLYGDGIVIRILPVAGEKCRHEYIKLLQPFEFPEK
jgi:hypothetical protein